METLIISAASDAGIDKDGAKNGALKLGQYLENLDNKVIYINNSENFIKDKNKNNLKKNEKEINLFNQKLYQEITTNKNKFPLILGGDHSIAIASVLASQKNNCNIGLIWFDAHPDFNTMKTTITGNIHGMPLAVIAGYEKKLASFHEGMRVNSENIVIIGARSIDKEELNNLKKAGVKFFTTADVKNLGIDYCVKEALKIASKNTQGIHISYDLDVIDPIIAPGVSIPESNGLNKEEAYRALQLFLQDMNKIVSMDLMEFNSDFDQDDKTFTIAKNLLNKILKKTKNK